MVNLDDVKEVVNLQGGDSVITSINSIDKQLAQAWKETHEMQIPQEFRDVKRILFCGMGGSRFPAIIVKELFKETLNVSIEIQDDYTPPAWAKEDTLVILSSYSGTTEEVVMCGKAAYELGARKFLGLTSGGDVASWLKEKEFPVYVFDPIHNPSRQPRIGLGYTIGGLLGFLWNLKFLDVDKKDIEGAISAIPALLSSFKLDVESSKNPAKLLAQKIHQHYPYFIVSEFLIGAGNAIQNQTNETAKSISSYRVISELNHHLMEGLKFPKTHADIALFIFFYSGLYSERIQKRFKITKEVVEKNNIKTHWHELQGKNKAEQLFELLGFGGYVSMYLSALYEQDPTAIPYVDYFKEQLKK